MAALLRSRLFMRRFVPIFIILTAMLAFFLGGIMARVHAGIMVREYAIDDAYPAAASYPKERFS